MDNKLIKQYQPLRKDVSQGDIDKDVVHYDSQGFVDSRYFWKTPKWVFDFNKDREVYLTNKYKEYPQSVLHKVASGISRLEGYETLRDVITTPEEYKNPLKIIQRYVQEVKDPQIDWRLKRYGALFKRYTREYPLPKGAGKEEEEEIREKWEEKIGIEKLPYVFKYKTLWADMTDKDKGKASEALNQYYELTDNPKRVKVEDLKREEIIIDLAEGVGLALEMSPLNPANLIFMGTGRLAKKAIQPVKASLMQAGMKTTLGSSASKIFRKVYVSRTINELGDEGITAMQRIIARSDDVAEAEIKFLNIYRPGWQGILGLPKEITKNPSLLDRMIEKVSRKPTGYKAIEYFGKKFSRGYGTMLEKDFISNIKALGIKKNSWEDIMVKNMLNAKHPESYIKHLTGISDEMVEGYNIAKNFNKQMLEIEKMLGTPYTIDEVQGYLFRLYTETPDKPIAFNIGREIGADKPIIAYNRVFKTVEEARAAGYIIADGFIEPMLARLKVHGDIMGRQGFMQAVKETYGEAYTRETFKELSEQGMRTVRGVKELKGYVFDNKLATVLERQKEVINLGKLGNTLVQFNKKVMTPIKKLWTFTTGFHARNFYGSHYQNATEFGWDTVLNANKQMNAAKLAWTTDDFGIKIGNKTYKSSALREWFDLSGMGAGWYRGELAGSKTVLGKFWDETMGKAGDLTEREVRMFSWLEGLARDGNYIDANLVTKLLHFDYLDGLTMAEKVYGRAAFPFYTWKRFNAPLQVYFLGTKTGRVANVFRTIRTMGTGEPSKIPMWFNQYLMGKIGTLDVANNIQKYLKLDLPLAQIGLLTPAYESLMVDKDLTLQERFVKFVAPFVAESNPFIKLTFEVATGFDTFRLQEIPTYKVKSPIPTFICDAFPDFLKNKFEMEKDKNGLWEMNAEWAKILETIPGLYQTSVAVGYGKYPDYQKQKWLYDQLSVIAGIKIYPIDEKFYSKLTERDLNKLKARKQAYEKKQKKLEKIRAKEEESISPLQQLIKEYKPLGE